MKSLKRVGQTAGAVALVVAAYLVLGPDVFDGGSPQATAPTATQSTTTPESTAPHDDVTSAPVHEVTATPGYQEAGTDFVGDHADIEYSPNLDGDADPGEVVWTWVPYEDDPSQGKDRPVLIIARHGGNVLGLMMTSQDRAPDDEIWQHRGQTWMDLGSGPWDSQGRPSDLRLDRVIVLDPDDIRREGAVLDEQRFKRVADAMKELKGW